jgi:hypothetical protein
MCATAMMKPKMAAAGPDQAPLVMITAPALLLFGARQIRRNSGQIRGRCGLRLRQPDALASVAVFGLHGLWAMYCRAGAWPGLRGGNGRA